MQSEYKYNYIVLFVELQAVFNKFYWACLYRNDSKYLIFFYTALLYHLKTLHKLLIYFKHFHTVM